MFGFSKFNDSLRMTSSQIEIFSKQDPQKLPVESIQEMTSAAKTIGDKLAKATSNSRTAQIDQKTVDRMVSNINSIRQKASPQPQKELNQMLEALDYLKGQLEGYQARAGAELAKRVTNEAKQINRDLSKQLTLTSKELAQLKQTFQKEGHLSSTELKEVEEMLTTTEGIVVKQIAMNKEMPRPIIPGRTQNIIGKILEDIKFLQYTIGVQVQVGTEQVQAKTFRSTLKKIQDRLRALQKLNKTRGEIAAQVEKDTQR